jgi:ribosomal RNA-processing protein 17
LSLNLYIYKICLEIKTYEDGVTKITVTTSDITRDDDDFGPKPVGTVSTSYTNKNPRASSKNSSLGAKKQQQKRTFKNKSKLKMGGKKRGAAKGKKKKGRK